MSFYTKITKSNFVTNAMVASMQYKIHRSLLCEGKLTR